MATKIEWTDVTWNPVIGCSKISDGCQNCYAEKMAVRLSKIGATKHYGEVVDGKKWNGKTALVESALTKPMHWRKPRKVFVCSMSDLFHESVPFEWIDRVFAVMVLCPQHTFQVLTKRPERMREYLSQNRDWADDLGNAIYAITCDDEAECRAANAINGVLSDEANVDWPMRNVWLGTTVESHLADERIPLLINTPAAVRFVSVEPMLGAVELTNILIFAHLEREELRINALTGKWVGGAIGGGPALDWVICGCESGPNARLMDLDWARSLRRQCKDSSVPFFLKQADLGYGVEKMPELDGQIHDEFPEAK